ncbi:N-acetyltransferase [Oceanobacillus oncorhynchi subsp. incaldanensis]|uniref:GNAT family N-acetyltransferase n=1 Tax=Oceanobacillus oncorhynchi TaxID=545501 RepID=UPI001B0E65EB|nr:GNAT family N-acetyltransferase [Oceanobacillus oncorhynchi]GIO20587.1 N-acetyltransferase [Oceanobacillus oncorhynchi subsp. incaldanensis]
MEIRSLQSSDYDVLIPQINDWWGGRDMAGMLPKLFFQHFKNTSFIAEEDDEMVGFLIGFLSQDQSDEAYIHFVGVHPDYRKKDIGKTLYEKFFAKVNMADRKIIRSITSPVNKTSIAFHQKMGFVIERGDKTVDGAAVKANYDGFGNDRVLFKKELT